MSSGLVISGCRPQSSTFRCFKNWKPNILHTDSQHRMCAQPSLELFFHIWLCPKANYKIIFMWGKHTALSRTTVTLAHWPCRRWSARTKSTPKKLKDSWYHQSIRLIVHWSLYTFLQVTLLCKAQTICWSKCFYYPYMLVSVLCLYTRVYIFYIHTF